MTEQRFDELMDRARQHLRLVLRFLSPDPGRPAVRMDFNGSALTAFDPFGPRHPARQELTQETIHVGGERIEVQPYDAAAPHSKIPRSEYDDFGAKRAIYRAKASIFIVTAG